MSAAYTIAPDEDDDDLVATQSTSLLPAAQPQAQGQSQGKGKGRADESAPAGVSGRIGAGPGNVGQRRMRQTVGGVQTETRCASASAGTRLVVLRR